MASTRNKNMNTEFTLQQRMNTYICDQRTSKERTVAYMNAIPCAGVNMGHMPNHTLAHNATDIESSLYGVGSSNLVTPKKDFTPRIKSLPTLSFFERMQTVIPEPLVIEKNQRPKFL